MVQLNDFSIFQWCKSSKQSVESIFNSHLFPGWWLIDGAGDAQYNPSRCWAAVAVPISHAIMRVKNWNNSHAINISLQPFCFPLWVQYSKNSTSYSTLYCKVIVESLSCVQLFCDPMDCSPPGASVLGDSPGKNTGVDCHALFQGIFPTQGSNPGLPHCGRILYQLSHQLSDSVIQRYRVNDSRTLNNLDTQEIGCSE